MKMRDSCLVHGFFESRLVVEALRIGQARNRFAQVSSQPVALRKDAQRTSNSHGWKPLLIAAKRRIGRCFNLIRARPRNKTL